MKIETPRELIDALNALHVEYMEQLNKIFSEVHDPDKGVFTKRAGIMEAHKELANLKKKVDIIKHEGLPVYKAATKDEKAEIERAADMVDESVRTFRSAVAKMIFGG